MSWNFQIWCLRQPKVPITSHFRAEYRKSWIKNLEKCQKASNISKTAKLRIKLRVGSVFWDSFGIETFWHMTLRLFQLWRHCAYEPDPRPAPPWGGAESGFRGTYGGLTNPLQARTISTRLYKQLFLFKLEKRVPIQKVQLLHVAHLSLFYLASYGQSLGPLT